MSSFETFELWSAFEYETVSDPLCHFCWREPVRVKSYDAVWELRDKEQNTRNEDRARSWATRFRVKFATPVRPDPISKA